MKQNVQFQISKRVDGDGGFHGAVRKALEQFTRESAHNLRRGQATVVATVAIPEEGAYFGIILIGPLGSLENLRDALAQTVSDGDGGMIAQLKRVGLD